MSIRGWPSMRIRDDGVRELLDNTILRVDDLRANLRDIRRINATLGWTRLAVSTVARHVHSRHTGAFSLLDVASGSADIPLAIARWAARAGIEAHIVATDVNAEIVALAREYTMGVQGIHVERQDALELPYAPGSFDIALCTLALHHFQPGAAVRLLRNLGRVGRHVLVFDLTRSHAAYLGALMLTNIAAMHAMTRHDAPASVRRAYTPLEARALAERAGLRDVRARAGFPFRLALEASGQA